MVLEQLGLSSQEDIVQLSRYFDADPNVKLTKMKGFEHEIVLTGQGIIYLETFEERKTKAERDNKIKDLQLVDLENRIADLEQQREFWQTSIDKNKDQILYLWVSMVILMLGLLLSVFSG